jgi:hypothetical protein
MRAGDEVVATFDRITRVKASLHFRTSPAPLVNEIVSAGPGKLSN